MLDQSFAPGELLGLGTDAALHVFQQVLIHPAGEASTAGVAGSSSEPSPRRSRYFTAERVKRTVENRGLPSAYMAEPIGVPIL